MSEVPTEAKAGPGARVLAAIGGLLLLFGAAVMYVVATNPDNLKLCSEVQVSDGFVECYDLSRTQYDVSRVFAAAAGLLAAAAGFLGFYVAATGKRGRLMVMLAGAAIILVAVTVFINQVL